MARKMLRGVLAASLTFIAQGSLAQLSYDDPFRNANRAVHGFNKTLDSYLVKPAARGYDAVMPGFAKTGVSNFFRNLDDVNVVVNDIFQLKLRNAASDSGRLLINTTVGVGGLVDVASGLGFVKNNEDFGQTLGYWGLGSGPYLVLPVLGSSDVRDAAALVSDFLFNPVFWLNDSRAQYGAFSLDTVNTRLSYRAAETLIRGDEYSFVRDAYLQRREYLVADGEVYDEFDDY